MKHSSDFIQLVNEAKARIQELDCLSLSHKLYEKAPLLLIDVREDEEWEQGKIPGAIHLSKGILERDVAIHAKEKGQEIVLYCGGGYRSALAADNLQKMGYKSVFSLQGGFREWRGLGLPIEA